MLFWRLFPPILLLILLVAALPAIAVAKWVENAQLRFELLSLLGSTTLAAAIVAAALCRAIARRVIRPLRDMARASETVAEGENSRRVYADPRDEVGQLGDAFNRMNERLTVRIAHLEEDREQLRTILGGMVEGVVALDAGQRILFANERAMRLVDFPPIDVVGRRLWEVVRHRPLLDLVRRALGGADPIREEMDWEGPTPRRLTVHAARLTGSPPRGAVLVLHDTTDLRRLERLRQEFVANVSHELKTPLAVIQACVETLLDGAADDPEAMARFLKQIADQGDRLNRLILDLLSLARIESGAEQFEFHAVPVDAVVGACVERHLARAEARQQTLDMVTGPPNLELWADEEAVEQILDNLLDNAVKYTPEGGRVTVGWREEGSQICLEVADTGIGIPETDLPRIFERFYRVDRARSRELGGTGLGLSIVKHLVQGLNGTIRAASRVGQGTTFSVRIPRSSEDAG